MTIRLRRSALAVFCIAAMLSAGNPALAEEENASKKVPIRNYDHFEFDTVVGSYFGIATFYTQDDKVTFAKNPVAPTDPKFSPISTDNEIFTGEIRMVMGGESIQGGVVIPYHNTQSDGLGAPGSNFGSGQDDIGDVRAHVKLVPFQKELFDLGGGLMLTFPGGGESVGITTGEVGVLPFLTGTVHMGPVDLNTHVGYQFFNVPDPNGAPESIVYGSTLKYRVIDVLGLRLEVAGQSFKSGEDRTVVAIEPGLDFLVETGLVDLVLSASGSYGLSGGAAGSEQEYGSRWGVNTISGLSRGQWGVGLAIGALWN